MKIISWERCVARRGDGHISGASLCGTSKWSGRTWTWFLFLVFAPLQIFAQSPVFVTSFTGDTPSSCPTVCPLAGAISVVGANTPALPPGAPTRTRTMYGYDDKAVWSITPTLPVAGGIYKIDIAHTAAVSCSADVVVSATSEHGSLSASCQDSPVFQRSYGGDVWQTLGYITNYAGVATPTITFTCVGGTVDRLNRIYIDAFKFSYVGCGCNNLLPNISILRSVNPSEPVLEWPELNGYGLQGATSLSPGNWANITNSIVVVNGRCRWTNSLPDSTAYFRLKYQP